MSAAWAAEALFRDLDDQVNQFTQVQFQRGDAAALRQQIDRFKEQLRAIDASARDVVSLRGGESAFLKEGRPVFAVRQPTDDGPGLTAGNGKP